MGGKGNCMSGLAIGVTMMLGLGGRTPSWNRSWGMLGGGPAVASQSGGPTGGSDCLSTTAGETKNYRSPRAPSDQRTPTRVLPHLHFTKVPPNPVGLGG